MTRYTIEHVSHSMAWRVLRDGETFITTHATTDARTIAQHVCDALNIADKQITERRQAIRELLVERRRAIRTHHEITERVRALMPEFVGRHSQCCPLGGTAYGLGGGSGETPCACGADWSVIQGEG